MRFLVYLVTVIFVFCRFIMSKPSAPPPPYAPPSYSQAVGGVPPQAPFVPVQGLVIVNFFLLFIKSVVRDTNLRYLPTNCV